MNLFLQIPFEQEQVIKYTLSHDHIALLLKTWKSKYICRVYHIHNKKLLLEHITEDISSDFLSHDLLLTPTHVFVHIHKDQLMAINMTDSKITCLSSNYRRIKHSLVLKNDPSKIFVLFLNEILAFCTHTLTVLWTYIIHKSHINALLFELDKPDYILVQKYYYELDFCIVDTQTGACIFHIDINPPDYISRTISFYNTTKNQFLVSQSNRRDGPILEFDIANKSVKELLLTQKTYKSIETPFYHVAIFRPSHYELNDHQSFDMPKTIFTELYCAATIKGRYIFMMNKPLTKEEAASSEMIYAPDFNLEYQNIYMHDVFQPLIKQCQSLFFCLDDGNYYGIFQYLFLRLKVNYFF